MSFNEFVYEQGILGVTMGTITGYAISNFTKDINREVILKLLKYFKVGNAGLLSAFLELLLLMCIVYLIYTFILYPIFEKQIELDKKEKGKEKQWKKDVLREIQNVDLF